MVLKSIILMRHAEREDRALEAEGKDWISTAPRPQDPKLSPKGIRQAQEVGRQLIGRGVTRILCSPMIRCVMTADCIAEVLGLGSNSINVEFGLVEEAKSFRGKTSAEPLPKWTPLILPVEELCAFSDRINTSYVPHWNVNFVKDEAMLNHVREEHDTLNLPSNRDEVTKDRCRQAVWRIVQSDYFENETILCVGHGATVGGFHKALEAELPEGERVSGDRTVSCYSEFAPVDPNNICGPWKSVSGTWATGDIFHDSVEDIGDQGLEAESK